MVSFNKKGIKAVKQIKIQVHLDVLHLSKYVIAAFNHQLSDTK